jgi:hypothetical protein
MCGFARLSLAFKNAVMSIMCIPLLKFHHPLTYVFLLLLLWCLGIFFRQSPKVNSIGAMSAGLSKVQG